MSEDPYQAPDSSVKADDGKMRAKPGPILIGSTVILVLANLLLSFVVASAQQDTGGAFGAGYLVGYITGRVFFLPVIVVGLFQIGKRFRNGRSQTKIFMWTSVVVFVSLLGTIGSIAQEPM